MKATLNIFASLRRISIRTAIGVLAIFAARSTHAQVTFTNIGSFNASSTAVFVSSDGSVVGGYSADSTFGWSSAGGMANLGRLPGAENAAVGSSASSTGFVVVGTSDSYDGSLGKLVRKLVSWTFETGWVDLGTPFSTDSLEQWDWSEGPRISENGLVVLGMSFGSGFDSPGLGSKGKSGTTKIWRWVSGEWAQLAQPPTGGSWNLGSVHINSSGSIIFASDQNGGSFRWTSDDGWVQLVAPNSTQAYTTDISSNGSVVVGILSGNDKETGNFRHLFRWTDADGMTDLGLPPFGELSNDGPFVSGDGLVIVGTGSHSGNGFEHAFRWENNVKTDLGTLQGLTNSQATALSSDGSVVVGHSWHENSGAGVSEQHHAFRWANNVMTQIEPLPGGATDAKANDVSSDGSVVVGVMASQSQQRGQFVDIRAFRWTNESVVSLGTLQTPTQLQDVSSDGSVVVGDARFGDFFGGSHVLDDSGSHAFRWTNDRGIFDLGLNTALGEIDSRADFVSGDGSVIIGSVWVESDSQQGLQEGLQEGLQQGVQAVTVNEHAFRWTSAGGKVDIGTLPNTSGPDDTDSYIRSNFIKLGPDDSDGGGRCVSSNGSVVVGTSESSISSFPIRRAFRWTNNVMTNLGTLPGAVSSTALAVSSDGLVVVGASGNFKDQTTTFYQAFRWTVGGLMQPLGSLPGFVPEAAHNSAAFFVSSNGSVIVGTSEGYDDSENYIIKAFRWTSAGMVDLGTLPGDDGLDHYWPVDMSSDGLVIAGLSEHRDPKGGSTSRRVFRWTLAGGMVALPATITRIHGVSLSGDGSIVAGSYDTISGSAACLWSAALGVVDLKTHLVGLGLPKIADVDITNCGISEDGKSIGVVYQIAGRDSAGIVSGLSLAGPLAPTNVAATDGTFTDKVVVMWTASAGATGYKIFRNASQTPIGTVGLVVSYSDTSAIPGTSYTYTVKAMNSVATGAASVSDAGFRNLSAPTGVSASDGTSTAHVAVTWVASTGATGYQVFRSGTTPAIGTAIGTTYNDATAAPGVLYTYTVKATGAVGVSTTSASDTGSRGLSAPTSVAATDGTSTAAVTVTWTASAGATGYQIFRSGTAAAIGTVGAVVTFSDTSAVPGTSYTYTVKAVTAAGLSVASFGDSGFRNLPAPAGVSASDGTSTAYVAVTWTASTGATGYQIFRSGTVDAIGTVGSLVTYNDTTAVAGTLYTYSVKATGVVGVSAASVGNTGYRNLTEPANVSATDGTVTTGVLVTWDASTGATGYQVFRSGTVAAVGAVGAVLTFSDTAAVPGTLYTYTVKAATAAGLSAASAGDTGYRGLGAPTAVDATDGTFTNKVVITWVASTGATGYQVFRSGTTDAIGMVGAVMTFSDMTGFAGVSYTYTVKATSAVGVSAASTGDMGYRNLAAPTGVAATDGTSTTDVTITWFETDGATSYKVFRSGTTDAIGTVGAVLTYSDTTAIPGTSYIYTVKALATARLSSASVGNTGYRNLTAPTNVNATDTDPAKVRVTWTAVTSSTGYEVFRSIAGASATLIGSPSSTTLFFDDTTIAPGVIAQYSLRSKFVLVGSSPATTVTTLFSETNSGTRP